MQANHPSPAKPDERNIRPGAPAPDAVMGNNFMLTNPMPVAHEPESVGELLRAARESAGFSVAEVANRLRMGSKQIDAIERADYAALPGGIFLRGFIRNYAKVVGIDSDAALATLERTHMQGSAIDATKVVAPSAALPMNMHSGGEWLSTPKIRVLMAVGVVVLLAAAVWYWWQYVRPHLADGGRPRPVGTAAGQAESTQMQAVLQPVVVNTELRTAVDAPAINPAEIDAARNALPAAAVVPPGTSTTTASAAAPVDASASATNATKSARRPGDTGQIGFTFSGQSWVEVIDGTGRSILSRRYNPGDFDEVSGRGPFSIVIGNVSVTRMAYNGREFDLVPHTRANSTVARVTVK